MPPTSARAMVLAVAAILGTHAGVASAAEVVNVGIINTTSDAPLYVAAQKGYFRDEGLEVRFVVLDAAAKMIPSLGNGELDVGGGALSVGFYNAIERGIGIRIVADRGHTAPGSLYQTVFIRKDLVDSGAFKSLADLKGKRIGFAANGVSALSVINEAAKAGGITYGDITPVFMGFPQQAAAMSNNNLDGSIMIEPLATALVEAGIGVRFMNTEDFYPSNQVSVMFYGEKFATQRREAAQKFMIAYLRGTRAYDDALKDWRLAGPGADEIVQTLSAELKLAPEVVRKIYSQGTDPNGRVNIAGIAKDLAFFREQKMVPGDPDLNKLIDMSFVDQASAALGPYKRKPD